MSRSSSAELAAAADALSVLASLVSGGMSLVGAVKAWRRVAPAGSSDTIAGFERRVGLTATIRGRPPEGGVEARLLWSALAAAYRAERSSSSACASSLASSAASLRRRAAEIEDASAATSGAALSGRLVAGLPIAFLLLVPFGGRPRWDVVGAAMAIAGVMLLVGGLRWMTRLTPAPVAADPALDAVRDLAARIRSGIPAGRALADVARADAWNALRRADRAAALGADPAEALAHDGDPTARVVGELILSGRRAGVDVAAGLERVVAELCESQRRSFDRRLRRAPVLMVVPLVFCVLPGFALLTLGPFLRSLLA